MLSRVLRLVPVGALCANELAGRRRLRRTAAADEASIPPTLRADAA
jgi:hypothetical protein